MNIAGMPLTIILIFALAVLVSVGRIIEIRKDGIDTLNIRGSRIDLFVLALLGWEIMLMTGKLFRNSGDGAIEYQIPVVMISLSLLYFNFKRIKAVKSWYFDLLLYLSLIVEAVLLYGFISGAPVKELIINNAADSGAVASFLLLPCMVSTYQYCMCRDRLRSWFYLMTAVISYFTLFLNHNIVSFWLMAFVFLAIPLVLRTTAGLVKRDMQLLFVFIFLLSNMSLLTNYTKVFQADISFDLEHSVYLELLLAIGGVFFFRQWDRIPEGIDLERVVTRKLRRMFRFLVWAVAIVFAGFILGGESWMELPDKTGAGIIKSFAVPLVSEVRNGTSGFVRLLREDAVGSLLILILAVSLITRIRRNHNFGKSVTNSLILFSAVFGAELLFWIPCAGSMPFYLMFVVLAAFYREEIKKVTSIKINFNREGACENENSKKDNRYDDGCGNDGPVSEFSCQCRER